MMSFMKAFLANGAPEEKPILSVEAESKEAFLELYRTMLRHSLEQADIYKCMISTHMITNPQLMLSLAIQYRRWDVCEAIVKRHPAAVFEEIFPGTSEAPIDVVIKLFDDSLQAWKHDVDSQKCKSSAMACMVTAEKIRSVSTAVFIPFSTVRRKALADKNAKLEQLFRKYRALLCLCDSSGSSDSSLAAAVCPSSRMSTRAIHSSVSASQTHLEPTQP